MEKRTLERFRKRSLWLHWGHALSFIILASTGGLMFLRLPGFQSGYTVRVIHLIAAAFFVAVPLLYCLVYPRALADFFRETFQWGREDWRWLKVAPGFYFGKQKDVPPPAGRINADQKLWQLLTLVTCLLLVITGILQWLFRMHLPVAEYQIILLVHAAAFLIVFTGFLLHFYLTSFHPWFEESLTSMIDGKVSSSFARKVYPGWYASTLPKAAPKVPPGPPSPPAPPVPSVPLPKPPAAP